MEAHLMVSNLLCNLHKATVYLLEPRALFKQICNKLQLTPANSNLQGK